MLAIMRPKTHRPLLSRDPFTGIDTFFDGLFGQTSPWGLMTVTCQQGAETADPFVRLEDGSLEATVALPGVPRDAVEVSYEGRTLTIRGATPAGTKPSVQTSYTRQWTIDTSHDLTKLTASLKDGILTVRIPVAAGNETQRVTVAVD